MIRDFFTCLLAAVFLCNPAAAGQSPDIGPIAFKHAAPGAYERVAQAIPFPGPGSRDRNIKVTGIGSAGTTAGGTTISMTTTAAIPAGSTVVVAISSAKASTISVSSVSDGTNSYALAAASGWGAATLVGLDFWYVNNANPVSSGATITATFSSTNIDPGYIAAALVLNLQSSPFDKSNFTQYSSPTTAPSSGATATLTQANEVCFGAATGYTSPATSTTLTESSGWTNLASINNGTSTRYYIIFGYKIVAATTAQNYQPTLGSAAVSVGGIATFKGY